MKNSSTTTSKKNKTHAENSKNLESRPNHPKIKSNSFVYEKITNLIIERLERGEIAWENPLINNCRPQNLVTGHIYRGINPFILSLSETPYFMTFKQAKQIGANIRKGAKSLPVVYWNIVTKKIEDEDTDEETEKTYYFLKFYNVFNISDIENIPDKHLAKTGLENNNIIKIHTAEEIISNYPNGPRLVNSATTPHYSPSEDVVRVPRKEFFKNSNAYYSTLFHEMAHSTGHKSRLDRFTREHTNLKFGSKDYAKEELTAELASAFLMAETGESINIENKAAYIQSWLKALKNDKKLIIAAAAKGDKAAGYILNN